MSGLGGKVRRATESDEFDLANYDQARCDELAKNAFTEPLPISQMVRLSFVVGGGKLVRQKYTDDLPKLFMSSLSAIGYINDDSAAVEAGSAGKYKFQHDTGKNLKFVHVFPKLEAAAAGGGGDGEDEEEKRPLTPEEKILRCGSDLMDRYLTNFLSTYGQKKALLAVLKGRIGTWNNADEKTRRLQKLTKEEEDVYNYDIGVDDILAKERTVSASMQAMIEDGQLTSAEQKELLASLEEKLQAIEKSGKKAPPKLSETIQKVKGISSVPLPPLKYAKEIAPLQRKLNEVSKLEASLKAKLGTVEQQRAIGDKPDIEEALSKYGEASRGWFEADEVFQDRLQACIRAASVVPKKTGGGGGAGGGYPSAGSAGRTSGGGRPAGGSSGGGGFQMVSGGKPQAKAKSAAPKTRNAFGALG